MIVEIPRNPNAPGMARAALDSCEGLSDASLAQAKLLVSELVTNSVKYGSDETVRLEIARREERLYVEVIDDGGGFEPAARSKPATDVGGWGLYLVDTLADRWGVHEDSSRVWFELGAAAA